MALKNFNEQSEKPKFIYKPNPLVPHSYQIFQFRDEKKGYEPVGDYTLIDTNEPIDITEKKMTNLISIMNEKQKLIDFKNLTKSRILFNIVPDTPESTHEKVIFRTHDGNGVSKENAVLTIEKGVIS
jgi:hypothetical protein